MKVVTLALALVLSPVLAARNNPERSFMVWMLADADATPASWAARVANIKAYGGIDIIFVFFPLFFFFFFSDHFSRLSQPCTIPPALCGVLYLVAVRMEC